MNYTKNEITDIDSIILYIFCISMFCCTLFSRCTFGNKKKYIKIKSKDTIYNECPICLEYFRENDKLARLSCDHVFHIDCIKQWISRESNCPICRIKI